MTDKRLSYPYKHGHNLPNKIKTPEYEAWCQMKRRCFGKKYIQYQDYGGRGITAFEPWVKCFITFLEHVGPKPKPYRLYSLDRIDNNGNYEPGNVRWATKEQQSTNRRPRSREKIVHFATGVCKNCGETFVRNANRIRIYCKVQCAKNFSERKRHHRIKEKKI